MFHSGGTSLGEAGPLSEYIRISEEGWQRDLSNYFTEDYIMIAQEEELIATIVDRNAVHTPNLLSTGIKLEDPVRRRHRNDDGTYSEIEQIEIEVPCSGEPRLFRYATEGDELEPFTFIVYDGHVKFTIPVGEKDADQIKEKFGRIVGLFDSLSHRIAEQSQEFNKGLADKVRDGLKLRKSEIQANRDFISNLRLHIEKKSLEPDSLDEAMVDKRIVNLHTPVQESLELAISPYIDPNDYLAIVSFIEVMGKRFEKLPSSYRDRDETEIRDLLVILLETQFRRSDSVAVTAETFNASGKTDILIQFGQDNVFAAECKFWNGKQSFHDAISQLLSYLTWRDGRAALIVFDPNSRFSNDLGTIRSEVEVHPNFIRVINDSDPARIHCQFYLRDDEGQTVDLTILVFHFPR